jgi:hypothetical protein
MSVRPGLIRKRGQATAGGFVAARRDNDPNGRQQKKNNSRSTGWQGSIIR